MCFLLLQSDHTHPPALFALVSHTSLKSHVGYKVTFSAGWAVHNLYREEYKAYKIALIILR